MSRRAANIVAELDLGRYSRGKRMYDSRILVVPVTRMNAQDVVRSWYKWEINRLKLGKWSKKLKEELDKLGFTYIGQCKSENKMNWACRY
jgi:hypothetical protein